MPETPILRHWLALTPLFAAVAAPAQTAGDSRAATPAASASAPAAAASAVPATAPATAGQQVQITGGREADTEQRRKSTAAKIVIGREEIDKFGDATLGEVLRRLPGVTTPGAPGRGGSPRLRGLGSGFTQLLIDGQRVPPGFSLESLSPEQVERIEILRAPTAETGARAIAGTINIVTRDGYKRRVNDVRLGLAVENGEITPGIFWTHNESSGPLTYNLTAGTFRNRRSSSNTNETSEVVIGDGKLVGQEIGRETTRSETFETRNGINLNARLQWRLSEAGDSLLLMPSVFHSEATADRRYTMTQTLPPAPPDFDTAHSTTGSRYTTGRLNSQWRQRLPDGSRLELNAGAGRWQSVSSTSRDEFRDGQATPLRHVSDDSRTSERSATATTKITTVLGGKDDTPGREHSLVAGAEVEAVNRDEWRTTLQDGRNALADFGDNLQASSLRLAAYAQDEWNLDANWALHAGLRWEGIRTRGDTGDGTRPTNRSGVWTPLVHLLWKPDPKVKDQVRLSLTRSYRSPSLGQLTARPTVNTRYPVGGVNDATHPDSAGNATLKPELASGIDLAFERYLDAGGVLSANLFARRITDVMRNVVTLEAVSYSPLPRWVSRPQNIGNATTVGIELEAKYRLDQLVADAPRVEMKHNLSVYRSRVDGVPGPDNRLDNQAPASANVGADYRLRGVPLTLGGNVGWTPGYRSQLADDRATTTGRKTVVDAYALWTINPETGLRLLASNLAARDHATSNQIDVGNIRETSRSVGPSFTNWQLRLELKL